MGVDPELRGLPTTGWAPLVLLLGGPQRLWWGCLERAAEQPLQLTALLGGELG